MSEKQFSVVKRNGSLVPFRKERISLAIEAAFRDLKKVAKEAPLPTDIKEAVEEVTDRIAEQLVTLAEKGASITVEGIQDLVEVTLMKCDHHDVAKGYILYRDQHKALREDSPQNLKVQRKDGTFARFNPMKIASSIEESFRRTRKLETAPSPQEVVDGVNLLSQRIVARVVALSKAGQVITAAAIEDEIEQLLMREGFWNVAKEYILHRASIGEQTQPQAVLSSVDERKSIRTFSIVQTDGTTRTLNESELHARLKFACRGLGEQVSSFELFESVIINFYEGMKESELDQAYILAARSKIEVEPAYSQVASRLLLDNCYRETLATNASDPSLESKHRAYFKSYFKHAISIQRIHPDLLQFDLDMLAGAIQLQRDDLFSYLGLQTLYDRYFIHEMQKRLETPQIFWMRVAMGLALCEKERKNERAIEFYDVLSKFLFVSSTPTLFNSGTMHPQLSSCYLSTVMDDLGHIFKVISDDAQLSKWAGGIGNDWTNVRATGAVIKGTNGRSQGVIPFLKVANDTAVAVNQCFDPRTFLYTNSGIKPIADVHVGDLVLGISGQYREVMEEYSYKQNGPMLELDVKHSLGPITVTTGHPFYALRGVPMEQANERTLEWLSKGKISCEWVDAGELQKGDYIAQIIPKEVVPVPGFTEEDARLYGILLGDGHLSKNVSSSYSFTQEDLCDTNGSKHIAPRFSHLPERQTLALLHGILETSGNVSRGKEIIFTNTSLPLIEGIRYQLLRLGIPTTGKLRNRAKGLYELRIPAVKEIAERVGCKPLTKTNWLTIAGHLFSRVRKTSATTPLSTVRDLQVDCDESYMTTAGLAHNGGKRKGAMCAYLETWHLDIEDFLDLRKNTGDERRRTHDMNTANWIPDLFMKRVSENGVWTLFSPSDVPDLHHLYGAAFEKRYKEYEKAVDEGKIKLFKKIEALQLWRRMLSMLFETGHPWITFKDPSNIRSPQDHVGVVHSSNLCTEILLNTTAEETAVCNLGSVNLVEHMTSKGLDEKKVSQTIRTAVRMLDNVIDINYYPTAEAKNANLRHRPIGLGIMGFQDALYMQNISYASHEAVEFADSSMEMISYYAILASSELALERGTYSTYKGSKWDRGMLPIDTIALLEKERGGYLEMDRSSKMNWDLVREKVKKHGVRNSNTMAIAPTATISNITGVTQSIEPMYKHLFVKSNLSGEFTVVNTFLVNKLKELGIWDNAMLDDLKYFDGSITEIERIPQEVKQLFLTAFEIDPEWIIECASRRQKWIDMGQSLNLYMAEPSGKKLHQMYLFSWTKGLKTNYYLRTLAATQIEKSTTDINARGLQPRWMKNKSASSDIQIDRETPVVEEIVEKKKDKPISCSLEEGCESCQ